MKNYIYAIGALTLVAGATPAIAQTAIPSLPYGQATAPARQVDPNAAHWVQMEGYDGNGNVSEHWELVRPHDYDVTNYRGFHTATD